MAVLALGASDCEALTDGLLGQPVNSLSSLAYVAAGVYAVRRGGPMGPALALVAVGAGSVLYHGPMVPGAEVAHDGSIALLGGTVLVSAWRGRTLPRPPRLAVLLLGVAVVVNLLTRTGAPLCRPDGLLKGHAVWHVLTAVATAAWLGAWRAEAPGSGHRSPTEDAAPVSAGAIPAQQAGGRPDAVDPAG